MCKGPEKRKERFFTKSLLRKQKEVQCGWSDEAERGRTHYANLCKDYFFLKGIRNDIDICFKKRITTDVQFKKITFSDEGYFGDGKCGCKETR